MSEYDEYSTPPKLVCQLIEKLEHKTYPNTSDLTFLDPCAGRGNWFKQLIRYGYNTEYCEILEGLDFYKCTDHYDVIIGNPPFSQMSKWLLHSMQLSNKYICYIMPAHSLSYRRLKLFEELGWKLTNIHSFDNPKEWEIGFAHFFCIWEYLPEESGRAFENDIIGRKEGVQKILGDFI